MEYSKYEHFAGVQPSLLLEINLIFIRLVRERFILIINLSLKYDMVGDKAIFRIRKRRKSFRVYQKVLCN